MQLSSLDRPTLALQPGDEPITGFRLIRCRGRGGFGEVWEAEAPGQFIVALKFVRLSTQARAAELRALDFVRGIHHPNLLANFGSWQVGDTLVIGMELADGSLWDRFLAATQSGDRGIPRAELLGYLSDVAAGVDHLNGHSHTVEGRPSMGVQHRDLKPPNILLFGGGAKVADLGMARAMEGEVAGHTGIWTFPYAAPEFFRGETTQHSDQYGLAVTYCQLRGGRLPFGGSAASVTAGHLFAQPNLDALPEPERPIVARALAKGAGDRWPNCRAFIEALRALPADAVPDRLTGSDDLADVSDDSLILADVESRFVPEDSGSGFMAISSNWLPDTADSGSAFAVAPKAMSGGQASPSPMVGHDFSLWSSFNSTLVLPAQPANSWVDIGSGARRRPAWSLVRRVGIAGLVGSALVAVASSGSHSEPVAGPKAGDVPPISVRVPQPADAEPTAALDRFPIDQTTAGPRAQASARSSLEPVPFSSTDTQEEIARDEPVLALPESPDERPALSATARPDPESVPHSETVVTAKPPTDLGAPASAAPPTVAIPPIALDPAPAAVAAVRPGLMLEGPREMGDSLPTTPADNPDRGAAATVARSTPPIISMPTPLPPDPPSQPTATTAPVVNSNQDGGLRRTRISLADLGHADPVAAESAYARGRELFRRSDFPAAIRAFDEAIRLNPGHATSHFARAITRDRAGDPRAALADYAEVLRVRPDDASAHLARGQIHHELGEYDLALADFEQAIHLRPNDADPRFRRGLARYRAGDYAGAADDFAATLQLDPKHAYAAGFRDESLARSEAIPEQPAIDQLTPGAISRGIANSPRPGPAILPAPLRETNYLAPPPQTSGARPGAKPGGTQPAGPNARSQPTRRPPLIRRLIPWPFSKPK